MLATPWGLLRTPRSLHFPPLGKSQSTRLLSTKSGLPKVCPTLFPISLTFPHSISLALHFSTNECTGYSSFQARNRPNKWVWLIFAQVIVIGGPTAVGKSKLSMDLVNRFNGVLVNADATKLYKGLDCGANKRAVKGMKVRLWDVVDATDFGAEFSAGQYHDVATVEIQSIIDHELKMPIVVGGSGLYLRWLLRGKQAGPQRDIETSKRIFEQIRNTPWDDVIARIEAFDPLYAKKVVENDYRRAARAIELNERTGGSIGDLQRQRTAPLFESFPPSSLFTTPEPSQDSASPEPGLWQKSMDFRPFFITMPRVQLYDKICRRCEDMIVDGLFLEVWSLMKRGLTADSTPGKAIGYRQTIEYLTQKKFNETTLLAFLDHFQSKTRQLAHRQLSWFRHEPDYVSVDLTMPDISPSDHIASLLELSQSQWQDYVKANHPPPEDENSPEMLALRHYQPPTGLLILPRVSRKQRDANWYRIDAERTTLIRRQLAILDQIAYEMDKMDWKAPSSNSTPVDDSAL